MWWHTPLAVNAKPVRATGRNCLKMSKNKKSVGECSPLMMGRALA